jgi:hypothetical protein
MKFVQLIFLVTLTTVSYVQICSADLLTVKSFSSPPNYNLCTDSNDKQQLTDGRVTHFPIWLRKGTVGWQSRTPIAIRIRFPDKVRTRKPHAGILRIHSVRGLYAGVELPQHFDIYSRANNGQLWHVGTYSLDPKHLKDKKTHWFDIEVAYATEELVLVIHASGKFIFLDEISWEPAGYATEIPQPPLIQNLKAALDDSALRLNESFKQKIHQNKIITHARVNNPEIWIQEQWGVLNSNVDRNNISSLQKSMEVMGFSAEHESLCIGIKGNGASSHRAIINISGLKSNSYEIFEVQQVFAANGEQIFDPLVPLASDNTLMLKVITPTYIWIDIDLSKLDVGLHQFNLNVAINGVSKVVPGNIRIIESPRSPSSKLHAINWAYQSDMPIFRNADAAEKDLVAHGINVFVAHPYEIPGFASVSSWDPSKAGKFYRMVSLAKKHGQLLLFLGWRTDRNPFGFQSSSISLLSGPQKKFLDWIQKISTLLNSNGLPNDRWAIYPIDEPVGNNLLLLKHISEVIKSKYPEIRIYANPIASEKQPPDYDLLKNLIHLIDIWQPNSAALKIGLDKFFMGINKEWWLYAVPSSPAKLASPFYNYRLLGWLAWKYGAKGVGFWSYSDTSGSSAWIDVDGQRPDWAVVYETKHGIVSSRRWEAFREGVEDYKLLSAFDRAKVEQIMQRLGKADFDQWQSTDLNKVRRELLDQLFQ